MNEDVFPRLRALLGTSGVERDGQGVPRAVPDSEDALSLVCQTANAHKWKIRVEGRGSWLATDAPADLALCTRGLDQVIVTKPADLVATAQAGVPIDVLRRQLAEHGMWLALDPPGRPDRTIGSVLATGTAGPLRHGFGPVRDHVLGCSVATGDGRLITAGGQVVKNVAGYDLAKLHIGGFGGFGIITQVHLRLRALPRADVTLIARGGRDPLTAAGRAIVAAQVGAAALELFSPALAADSQWVLAARLVGSEASVQAETRRLQTEGRVMWETVPVERSGSFWGMAARAALGGTMTIRLGALVDGLDEILDLVAERLDEGLISAGVGSGAVRWSGEADPERLRTLRRIAAAREVPVTLERAPWWLRRQVGHFGAYREGVGPLVESLRRTFDPGGRLVTGVSGAAGDG